VTGKRLNGSARFLYAMGQLQVTLLSESRPRLSYACPR